MNEDNVFQLQPKPVANKLPEIADIAILMLDQRRKAGIKTYGVPLQGFNGRDALQDAAEEAADLLVYLLQAIYERDHGKQETPS